MTDVDMLCYAHMLVIYYTLIRFMTMTRSLEDVVACVGLPKE
jgi:hypothetical protein